MHREWSSRNTVSVGEPADGSFTCILKHAYMHTKTCMQKKLEPNELKAIGKNTEPNELKATG